MWLFCLVVWFCSNISFFLFVSGILEWFPHFPFPFHRNPKLNRFQLLNLQEKQQREDDENDSINVDSEDEHKTPTILWNKCSDALRVLPSDHFYALPKQLHFSILYLLQRPPFCFRFRLYDLACWLIQHLDEFRIHPRLVSDIILFENAVSVSLKACNLGVLHALVQFDPEWFNDLSDGHWIRRKMMTVWCLLISMLFVILVVHWTRDVASCRWTFGIPYCVLENKNCLGRQLHRQMFSNIKLEFNHSSCCFCAFTTIWHWLPNWKFGTTKTTNWRRTRFPAVLSNQKYPSNQKYQHWNHTVKRI